MQDRCLIAGFYNLHGPSDFSQRLAVSGWSCERWECDTGTLNWVTEPGESGQVRVKGYLHFTGDGRLCHDYVTSPVTMSHLSRVSGPRGAHDVMMVSSSHTQHMTLMTLRSIAVNPLWYLLTQERFINTFNLIIWALMISKSNLNSSPDVGDKHKWGSL